MKMVGDIDYEIIVVGTFGTKSSKTDSHLIYKVGSLTVTRARNTASTLAVVLAANSITNQIVPNDTVEILNNSVSVLKGHVKSIAPNSDDATISLNVKCNCGKMAERKVFDMIYMNPTESYFDEVSLDVDYTEPGGDPLFKTLLNPTDPTAQGTVVTLTLETDRKYIVPDTTDGLATEFNQVYSDGINDLTAGIYGIKGKNSMLNKIAIDVQRAAGDDADHNLLIKEWRNGGYVTIFTKNITNVELPGFDRTWLVIDVDTQLKGDCTYAMVLEPNGVDSDVLKWFAGTAAGETL